MTGNAGKRGDVLDLSGSGAEPLEAEDPRRIGAIPLVGRLGSGGMGRVYLGVHEGRYAAVKQVLPSVVAEDKDFLRRFGHELDNLSRLPEEATAPLLASDREARPPWFATAYVPGLTLREAVELHGHPLPADALWLLLREAASGLAAVHALDMVHRDLKPSNVMLTLDGLTLIDFGVARAAEQSQLTRTGIVVGTPAYMSPEQASGTRRLSGAADVFALGSMAAYAACGRPPFGDDSGHAVLYRIVHEQPDLAPLRALDPALAEVVAACLDKDFEGRPTTAELAELAAQHGPFADPPWPRSITEPLSERAAFAATVPKADKLPAPVPTLPSAEPEPKEKEKAGPEAGPDPKRRERRRTRVLFAVVPVVVVATGATLAVRLLPFTSSPDDEARSTPSASLPASLDPTRSSSGASPSGTAKSPSSSVDQGKGKGKSKGKGTGGTQADAGGAGAQAGSDTSDSSDGSRGSGGDSGSSSGSGGTSTKAPASGYYQLTNAADGQCLVMSAYSGPVLGECSDSPAASWAYKSMSGGSFHVVNEHTGQCLSVNAYNIMSADCDQSTQVSWRTGSGGTLQNMYNSRCLDESAGWPVTSTCVSGTASQRWTRK
ncbi:serine/threonine-protein kinase [Streptomyces sp. Tue6028]|uniref:serine/threonine-protein kinase n=1 Tax=Streptomyces sp. Tue6028 TaxID=2036037 RepID=UPI00117CD39B